MTLIVRSGAILVGMALLAGCGNTSTSGTGARQDPGGAAKEEPKTPSPVTQTNPGTKPTAQTTDQFRELTAEQAKKYPSGTLSDPIELADTWELREVPSSEVAKKQDETRRDEFRNAVKGLNPANPDDQVKVREAAVRVFGKQEAERIGVLLRVKGTPKYIWP